MSPGDIIDLLERALRAEIDPADIARLWPQAPGDPYLAEVRDDLEFAVEHIPGRSSGPRWHRVGPRTGPVQADLDHWRTMPEYGDLQRHLARLRALVGRDATTSASILAVRGGVDARVPVATRQGMCGGVSRNDGEWWLGGKLRADDDADTRHRQSAWAIHSLVLRFAVIAWSFYPLAMNRLLSHSASLVVGGALLVWVLIGFWCEGSARRLADERESSARSTH